MVEEVAATVEAAGAASGAGSASGAAREVRCAQLGAASGICSNICYIVAKFASISHVPTLGCAEAPPVPGPGRPGHRARPEDAPERLVTCRPDAAEVPAGTELIEQSALLILDGC